MTQLHSVLKRSTLAFLGLSLLIGCSSQLPVAPRGQVPGTMGRFNAQTQVSNERLLTDNFGAWIRQKQRQDGFVPGQEAPQPVEGQEVAQLPKASGQKPLTYMTYEALDNNLHPDLNRILDTLEVIGSNANMNLIAQTDNLGVGNAARYFIQSHSKLQQIASPHLKLGEAAENSGDPRVFADAVRWGFNSYPARFNWLNISTHGMGFAGINTDDNPEAAMNIISFNQALKAGLGQKKLDIISFDACLMATVEVASELQDSSNLMVGSEDSTYYWGYGYQQTFSKMAQNPALISQPEQVVRSLVMDVNNKGASNQTLTISATDLRKMGELEAELDKLSRVLRRLMPTQSAAIIRAARASKEFTLGSGIPFRDLNRLLALLKQNVKDPEFNQVADRINHVMYRRGLILFARQSRMENDQGRGLSIYLPTEGEVSELYRQTRFARSTQWDEFLLDMNKAIRQAAGLEP